MHLHHRFKYGFPPASRVCSDVELTKHAFSTAFFALYHTEYINFLHSTIYQIKDVYPANKKIPSSDCSDIQVLKLQAARQFVSTNTQHVRRPDYFSQLRHHMASLSQIWSYWSYFVYQMKDGNDERIVCWFGKSQYSTTIIKSPTQHAWSRVTHHTIRSNMIILRWLKVLAAYLGKGVCSKTANHL